MKLTHYATAAIYALSNAAEGGWRQLVCDNIHLERPGEAKQELHEFALEVLDLDPGVYVAMFTVDYTNPYVYLYTFEVNETEELVADEVVTLLSILLDEPIPVEVHTVRGARPVEQPVLMV